jgi:hypothetical protein
VQIAELNERAADEIGRQAGNGQSPIDELQPLGLDPPRVQAGDNRRSGGGGQRSANELAPVQEPVTSSVSTGMEDIQRVETRSMSPESLLCL